MVGHPKQKSVDMDEFSLETVARKSVKGVAALVSRTLFIQILNTLTYFIVLVPFLGPEILGIFTVTSAILVFFAYFQDIGLAASLIQKQKEPTEVELRSVFTIQQILVLLLILPALFFSRAITSFYHLDSQGHLLFIGLLVSFLLTSLRTIPTILLERKLEFDKLVIPQVGEAIVFNALLIPLAFWGFGVSSFTVAVLARSVVGLFLTYLIKPWRIGFAFHMEPLKHLVSFGIPFQLNSVLALLKDDLLTVYIGKVLPFSHVGFIGFAQKAAFTPLRLVMDNVIKVTFPSYSRLQHDTHALKIAIEKSLFLISFAIFPTAVALIAFSPYLIALIPKYQKWEGAIVSIIFFSLNTVFSSISTPLTNFLNAIGKVKITLYFMFAWTLFTWVVTLLLMKPFGFNGIALASFLVSISSVFVIVVCRLYVTFSVVKPVIRQLVAAIAMGLFIYFTKGMVQSLPLLFFEMLLSALFYLGMVFILAKDDLLPVTRFIIRSLKKAS